MGFREAPHFWYLGLLLGHCPWTRQTQSVSQLPSNSCDRTCTQRWSIERKTIDRVSCLYKSILKKIQICGIREPGQVANSLIKALAENMQMKDQDSIDESMRIDVTVCGLSHYRAHVHPSVDAF